MKPATLLVLLLLAACGAPARPSPAPVPKTSAPAAEDAGAQARDPLPSLEELEARGASEAPRMRVVARVEKPGRTELTAERDQCFRAVVGAIAPVRAWFEDASGARGEAGAEGMVPPRGPVCVKKGEAVRLVVEGGAARAVVLTSP